MTYFYFFNALYNPNTKKESINLLLSLLMQTFKNELNNNFQLIFLYYNGYH